MAKAHVRSNALGVEKSKCERKMEKCHWNINTVGVSEHFVSVS